MICWEEVVASTSTLPSSVQCCSEKAVCGRSTRSMTDAVKWWLRRRRLRVAVRMVAFCIRKSRKEKNDKEEQTSRRRRREDGTRPHTPNEERASSRPRRPPKRCRENYRRFAEKCRERLRAHHWRTTPGTTTRCDASTRSCPPSGTRQASSRSFKSGTKFNGFGG